MNYFSEKTSISTPNGYRNLSDLKKGDQIWTWSGTAFKSTKIKNIHTQKFNHTDIIRAKFEEFEKYPIICHKNSIWLVSNLKESLENMEGGSSLGKRIHLNDIQDNDMIYHISSSYLRSLNNVSKKDWMKKKLSDKMKETNKTIDHSKLPQNTKGFKHDSAFIGKAVKRSLLQWQDEEFRNNVEAGRMNIQKPPTKYQQAVINLIEQNKLPFNFTGGGRQWINHINPDFIHDKKVIDLYNSVSSKFFNNKDPDAYCAERQKKYSELGYKSCFIEYNIAQNPKLCLKIINKFLNNGLKLLSKQNIKNINNDITLIKLELEENLPYFVYRLCVFNNE